MLVAEAAIMEERVAATHAHPTARGPVVVGPLKPFESIFCREILSFFLFFLPGFPLVHTSSLISNPAWQKRKQASRQTEGKGGHWLHEDGSSLRCGIYSSQRWGNGAKLFSLPCLASAVYRSSSRSTKHAGKLRRAGMHAARFTL